MSFLRRTTLACYELRVSSGASLNDYTRCFLGALGFLCRLTWSEDVTKVKATFNDITRDYPRDGFYMMLPDVDCEVGQPVFKDESL